MGEGFGILKGGSANYFKRDATDVSYSLSHIGYHIGVTF